jgi:hypothetical protein
MNSPTDLSVTLSNLIERASTKRIPNWAPRSALFLDGGAWTVVTVEGDALVTHSAGEPDIDTTVFLTSRGAHQWLVGGVDFTHLAKSGDLTVGSGTYFDVLLLSKALGLRPERKGSMA